MNTTSNTTKNITDAMANVALTQPQRHNVYIVKYKLDHSCPEGDWTIYVKTEEHTGDIHYIASKDAGAHLCYTRTKIGAHEVTKEGEGPVLIGTTLTQNYPGGWDEALGVVKENLRFETTCLTLPGSTQAGVKVSRWTQECARPALERAGLLEKMESKEIEEKKKKEGKEGLLYTMENSPTLTNPRFTLELEFVSSLANPYYLSHLAVTYPNLLGISRADDDDGSSSPDAQAFAAYLAYLYSYWKTPEYSQFLTHPGPTLRALRLLQEDTFRRDIILPQVIEGLAGVSVPEPAQTETDTAGEKQEDSQNQKT
ncbi:hypothetical protein N7524_001840 [Penicillium chrysogenum]|nr:hypothetical protein N7524_001840 [Penicillium chrysogenum]